MDYNAIACQVRLEDAEPMDYDRFRTFLTYAEVYYMIWGRQNKRRNGVLGKWREIKLQGYSAYVDLFWEMKGNK